jgi:predicted transcriptional regulator
MLKPTKLFEKFGIMDTLLYYREHSPIQRIDYRTKVGLSPSTSMHVHELLFEYGLITTHPMSTRLFFKLTKKGKRIADIIYELKQEMLKEYVKEEE